MRRRCIPDTSAQEGGSGGSRKGGREGVRRGDGNNGLHYPDGVFLIFFFENKNFKTKAVL